MLVKCKICGKKIDRNEAYKVTNNKKNSYYCSEEEYNQKQYELECRKKTIDISMSLLGDTTNTALMKELHDISKVHGYVKMAEYLEDNAIEIHKSLSKEFPSEYAMIRYFTAILKNSLADYVRKEDVEEFVNIDVIEEVKYKSTVKKSFFDLIDDYVE